MTSDVLAPIESPWKRFRHGVREDHAAIRRYVAKYGSAEGNVGSLAGDVVRKVGLQIMVAYRLMRYFYEARWPLLPMLTSRLTRHLFGCDIHWKAEIEPGVMIVHGMGLAVSHGARVATGAILFQNVTLGEGIDPVTREVGAPTLEQDVHVAPGATLLGPIVVGAASKVMAGCVVRESVPPGSLVEAPVPRVKPRRAAGQDGAGSPDEERASS